MPTARRSRSPGLGYIEADERPDQQDAGEQAQAGRDKIRDCQIRPGAQPFVRDNKPLHQKRGHQRDTAIIAADAPRRTNRENPSERTFMRAP